MQLIKKVNISRKKFDRVSFSRGGLILVIAATFLIGSFISPYFLQVSNFQNIVRNLAVTGILAIGETFVVLTGGIDLSVGGVLALCGIIAALYGGSDMATFIILSLVVGLLMGIINGVGVASKRIPPFIMTLAILNVCRGASFLLCKNMPIFFTISGFTELSTQLVLGVPLPGFIFLIVALIAMFILKYLPFGREIYAVGSNAEVARFSGLNVKRTLVLAYAASGLLAGLAAIVYTSYTSVAQANGANGFELDAIAMTVVGGTSLSGGRGGIAGTLLGVILMALLRNIFNLLNFQSPLQQVLMGVCLGIAVLLQSARAKKD